MYYSSGNFEAFARPAKPEGADLYSAWIIGSGIAGLSAACFLIRDAQIPGERIHILDKNPCPGGACTAPQLPEGTMLPGLRELDTHYECLWDLLRAIPSLEEDGLSVLDEFYRLNQADPNTTLARTTASRARVTQADGKFRISDKGVMEILALYMTPDEQLEDKRIADVLDEAVFHSEFWTYWRTVYALKSWHSALEMKRLIKRVIHRVSGLGDFSALRFPRFTAFESIILPVTGYLEGQGVHFHWQCPVTDADFELAHGSRRVTRLYIGPEGREIRELTEHDLVFFTPGGCGENLGLGSQDSPAPLIKAIAPGGGWALWQKLAARDRRFGRPDKFCQDTDRSCLMSATVTTLDRRIPAYIQKVCGRDPFSGKTVTGGMVTASDSSWLLSWGFGRQPQLKNQPAHQLVGWISGLVTNKPGNFIQKPMRECTGREICMEWLYHLGVPEHEIAALAADAAITIPCMLPFMTAFFMPRRKGDRPEVVPSGSVNFAFLGQFAETGRDTVFSMEYSVRTAMEAVYALMHIRRGVPEVWAGEFDLRILLDALVVLRDGRKIQTLELGFKEKIAMKEVLRRISGTDIEALLKEHGAL